MAKTMTVRITKTWHIEVPLEYGDTDEDIESRALDMLHDPGEPEEAADSRTVTLMHNIHIDAAKGLKSHVIVETEKHMVTEVVEAPK